jgi:hypothetical protein
VQKGLRKGKEKSQHVLTTLVSTGTGRDEKGTLISAPSIQIGALVGAGSGWLLKDYIQNRTLHFMENLVTFGH